MVMSVVVEDLQSDEDEYDETTLFRKWRAFERVEGPAHERPRDWAV
jgi:hypothetical protein